MNLRIKTIASLAVAGTVAAGCATAPAQAAPGFGLKSAVFKVEVEGVQTNAWKTDHANQGGCDVDIHGDGTEVVRFKSKPKVVKLYQFGQSTPLFLNSGKRHDKYVDLASTITRRGSVTTSGGQICSYGDGTGSTQTPKPPDCGTKRSVWYAELNYSSKKRDFLKLDQALVVPLGPFYNCPNGDGSWPSLLDRTPKGEVGQRLPARDLFGPNQQHVIRAAGRDEYRDTEDWHQTTIQYSIRLTRIGKVSRS
jgi:hypothetical protein